MTCRVLIVDDHAGFRRLARALLEPEGIEVVGEAVTGRDALALVTALNPDAVLLDVGLPDIDGFAVCRGIRADRPAVRVVLCSVRPITAYGARYAECGAHAFAAKDEFSAAATALMLDPGGPASA
jgi:DNA-binding NarL/FixJ family response regulator